MFDLTLSLFKPQSDDTSYRLFLDMEKH